MRITVHIGAGKTGTSSIQKALQRNLSALEAAGIFIPASDLTVDGKVHGYQVFGFQDLINSQDETSPERFDAMLGGLVAKAEAGNFERILFSAENLSNQVDWAGLLGQALAKHEVDVLFYIRRQDLYFLSAYQQWGLKTGLTFDQWFFRQKDHRGDWAQTLKTWQNMASSIKVRVYERQRLAGGDVVQDFFEHVGIDGSGLQLSGHQENHSYSLAAEELALSSPNLFENAHDNRFFHFLDEVAMGSQIKKSRESRVTFERRMEVLNYFEQSNEYVASHYTDDADLPLRFTQPEESDFDFVPPNEIDKLKDGLLAEILFGMHLKK